MQGFVGEDGEGARGLARGPPPLTAQPIQVVAALRSQIGAVASDQSDAVRVLDEADVVTRFVAADRDRLLRDTGGLLGEARRGGAASVPSEGVPARPALDEPDDDREHADDTEAGEEPADGRPAASALFDDHVRPFCGPLARLSDTDLALVLRRGRV